MGTGGGAISGQPCDLSPRSSRTPPGITMTSASARGLGSVEFVFEDDDVVYLLRDAIEREGGQVAFAESGHEFSALQCPLCAQSGPRNLAASFFDIQVGLGVDGSTAANRPSPFELRPDSTVVFKSAKRTSSTTSRSGRSLLRASDTRLI